jgi:RNA polymerase II subunit A-like phosphatase
LEEPCTHETQFGGLCVECGKDMTEVDYLTKDLDSDRATVNMTHDNVALLVSQKEASRAEEDSKKRLLNAKKLSLIVDLDQTVIHTTCERTIAEWKDDPDNPNYEALKDVVGFQLADDNVAHVAANWYYVKMRPGLQNFLEEMSQLYEMHVYTMATRAYAQAVAKIIDPERKYFGDRILSRDENYTDKLKSLHRLFPNNTDMAVIIDDRADIWGYSENLVRVPVFNFFPGAGDINASFLPKQQELVSQAPKPKVAEIVPAAVTETETADEASQGTEEEATVLTVAASPAVIAPAEPAEPAEPANGVENDLEHKLLAMGAAESHEKLEEQAKEQEKVIIAQQTERPLLQAQLELDKEDGLDPDELHREADDATGPVENGHSQSGEHHKHRHSLLNNDDRGIEVIAANLRLVHRTFYDEYRKAAPQGSRLAELKGEKSPKKRLQEDVIPDVAEIMSRIKSEVLDGYVIVFSGIIPLGVNVQK